jgi:hypothetical protein
MKHHTVYKTTSLTTGEYYVGVHLTENPNDTYLGSGYRIVKAVKDQGRENFKKEILFDFSTTGESLTKEIELIDPCLDDPLCLNISRGGQSPPFGAGLGVKKAPRTAEHRRNLALAISGVKHSAERRKKNSEVHQGVKLPRDRVEKSAVWHRTHPYKIVVPHKERGIKVAAKLRGRVPSEEEIRKNKEALLKLWQNPEFRKQRVERMRQAIAEKKIKKLEDSK